MRRFFHYGVGALLLAAALFVTRMACVAVITGGSMAPTLVPGDVCIVMKTKSVSPGDLMLFESVGGGRAIVHRAVSIDAEGIHTKGDANRTPDRDPVSADRVEGRVVHVLRLGRLLARLDSASPGDTLRSQSHSRR